MTLQTLQRHAKVSPTSYAHHALRGTDNGTFQTAEAASDTEVAPSAAVHLTPGLTRFTE
jgi:hypothetical protein